MAQRFGGRFSPGARQGADDPARTAQEAMAETRRVDAAGARANLLFVPAAMAAFTGLLSGPASLILSLGAAAVLGLSAWLLRDGLRAEAAYAARAIARRPALPRKMLASVLTGGGALLAALSGGHDLVGGLLYGAAAIGLHLAAFGLDPFADKRVEGVDLHQQDRVARVVEEAEGYLATIREQIATLGDRGLASRVAGFEALARRLIRSLEEDPRDLTAARKYLGVYLMGARDATQRFVELYRRSIDPKARADYEALLGDLEANYAQGATRLLEGGREAMDLEITVLRDRLRREGVTIDR